MKDDPNSIVMGWMKELANSPTSVQELVDHHVGKAIYEYYVRGDKFNANICIKNALACAERLHHSF